MNQTAKFQLRNSKSKWIKFFRRWGFLMERHNFIKVLTLKESLLSLAALVTSNSWFSIYKLHFCNLELEMILGIFFTPTHLQWKMLNIYKLVIRKRRIFNIQAFKIDLKARVLTLNAWRRRSPGRQAKSFQCLTLETRLLV